MAFSLDRMIVSTLPILLFGCNLGGADAVENEDMGERTQAQTETSADVLNDAQGEDAADAPEDAASEKQAKKAEPQYSRESETLAFTYQWPTRLSDYPALKRHFDEEAKANLAEVKEAMAEDERLRDPDSEFRPQYSSSTTWEVDGSVGRLISLSADWYNYMGGAHGMHGQKALLFDGKAGQTRDPLDLFADEKAAREAIQPDYCDLLDKERARRRGNPVERSDTGFNDCIDPLEQTLIVHPGVGSDTFDRLTVYAGPYAAGPYAEGDYVIDMPVTKALLAAIKPSWRSAFAISDKPGKARKPE